MTGLRHLLIILLVFEATDTALGVYCILDIPETSAGVIFTGNNLSAILTKPQSGCTDPVSPSNQIHDSHPYFKVEQSSLTVLNSTRLEPKHDPKVGNGTCSGTKLDKDRSIPKLNLRCAATETSCTIQLSAVDNFPPFFCFQNCTRIQDGAEVHLKENQPYGDKTKDNPFFSGQKCDEDAGSSNGNTGSLSVIDSSNLTGHNMQGTKFNLWLLRELDYETRKTYQIQLVLKSDAHSDVHKTMVIHVEDVDDQSPAFTEQFYTCDIKEGKYLTTNDTSCKVEAFDQDFGINASVTYELVSYVPTDLRVNFATTRNGKIQVNGELDRENITEFILNIMAYQVGRKSDRYNFTTVIIHVTDKDDNPPKFDQDQTDVQIMENTDNNIVIFTPTVTDRDQGENAKFQFSMNDSSVFKINSTSGDISVKDSASLDREKHPKPFKIQITVTSTTKTSFTDTMILRVHLLDVNDNSPIFTNNSQYMFTIPKNYAVQKGIGQVKATDIDSGLNGKISYTMNNSAPFVIDETTGIISLSTTLKDTTIQHYELDIKAYDKSTDPSMTRSSWARVSIDIKDVNIHTPKFKSIWEVNEITENGNKNSTIAVLNCTDMDWNDTLNVMISSGGKGDFSLTSLNGNLYRLSTTKPLDRETTSKYTIQLTCSDGLHAHDQQLTVAVHVVDQNDNPPVFRNTSVVLIVAENEGKQFGKLVATDKDNGVNRNIVYSVAPDNVWRQNISIDNSTGSLTINPLDREALDNDVLTITILAVDGGSPSLTGTVDVKVKVTDVNDNAPVFTHYVAPHVYLHEDETYIDNMCMASDVDKGKNGEIKYTIQNKSPKLGSAVTVSGNGSVVFNLATVDIDDKTMPDEWTITVVAYNPTDYTDNIKNNTCVIKLHIQDINDKLPSFEGQHYTFSVNETDTSGTLIGSVSATDADRSPEYSIVEYIMDNTTDVFRVDRLTGEIYLNKMVDYETQNHTYIFKIYAIDADTNQSDVSHGTTEVTITVNGENDNPPKFDKDFSRCFLEENHMGLFSCTVHASDADGNAITYRIESSNSNFSINSNTGELSSKEKLDYETTADGVWYLNVSATDGQFPVFTTVAVELTNINEKPEFTNNSYTFYIYENGWTNQIVGTVHVTNQDSKSFAFSLDAGSSKNFSITQYGELIAKQPFDRETQDKYSLVITASQGPFKTRVNATVHMIDRNDNAPSFSKPVELRTIQENSQAVLGPFTAKDTDSEENGKVSYFLIIDDLWSENITINTSTGQITIQPLDRESLDKSELEFTILAVDNGTIPLSGSVKVKVTVEDVNDNVPVFTDCFNQSAIYLKEGEINRDPHCLATDPDKGDNGKVLYHIQDLPAELSSAVTVSDNGSLLFDLTNVDVDKTTQYVWDITVEAYNQNPYSTNKVINNTCVMKLHVLDIDDNIPRFVRDKYSFTIKETTSTGTLVGSVSARDADRSPEYSIVEYSLDNTTDVFRVDRLTGEIYLNKMVDYETQKHTYIFKVYATDVNETCNGCDTTLVTIKIDPENDHAPLFQQDFTSCTFPENYAGKLNCSVRATDPDGDKIKYTVEQPNSSSFSIDSKGTLYSNSTYDFETTPDQVFYLNVSANDRLHHTYAIVAIKLTNINDEAPQFSNKSYRFEIFENNLIDQVIGVFHVTYQDSENITFTITNQNDFHVTKDGELRAKQSFDRETQDSYDFEVAASDGIQNITRHVHVDILDRNDNAPTFYENGNVVTEINLNITENEEETFRAFSVNDTDKGKNRDVSYELIIYDSWQNNITINTSTGQITTQPLDRESLDKSELEFTILAVDNGTIPLTGTVKVKVTVGDVNDNMPVFTDCFNQGDVYLYEETVYTNFSCQASDADEGVNGIVQFFSKPPKSISKSIRIDTNKGNIMFSVPDLDVGETLDSGAVTIIAYDRSGIRNGTRQTFQLHILDVNDNSPIFNNNSYSFTFNETTQAGSRIGSVNATDKDRSVEYHTVEYIMVTATDLFRVDRITGAIYLNTEIDYDTENNTYRFQVNATDGTNNATTDVQVTVTGVNDIAPQFTQELTVCELEENHTGKFNCDVTATDLDRNDNTKLVYAIESPDYATHFKIDDSGSLRCTDKFDYEHTTNHSFFLNVSASDGVNKGFTTVVIELININDVAPQFDQLNYTFNINENNEPNRIVGAMHVFDMDSENVTLTINNTIDFNVTKEGNILALRTFDAETVRVFTIRVTANDGLNTAEATVIVNIDDLNDNTPEFNSSVFQSSLKVNESSPIEETVLKVNAVDADRDSPNNQVVHKLLDGNINNTFSLNETNGELVLQRTINATLIQQFTFVIEARDAGSPSLSNITTITINIIDENNNPPYFLFTPYVGSVGENTNNSILKIHAADPDLDSHLTYHVVKDDAGLCNFSFVHNVLYASHLDAEATVDGAVVCNITVTDGVYNTTTTVEVHIVDVNDNSPIFNNNSYSFAFKETTQAGSRIGSVHATDKDRSVEYHTVEYIIVTATDLFRVDRITGVIYLNNEIDYDTENNTYRFQVNATDGTNNATTDVQVTVTGVNDIAPQFTQELTVCELEENHTGKFNCDVTATDLDRNDNTKLVYAIESPDYATHFKVDDSGSLRCTDKFDYEHTTNHSFFLNVSASDGVNKGFTTVAIKLININDEAPQFDQPNYTFYINENNEQNRVVGAVHVFDVDSENVTLTIKNAIDFNLTKDGNILVLRTFNAETDRVFTLQVTANDGLNTADTTIIVNVDDLNDNAPEFSSSIFQSPFTINESRQTGDTILKINAIDSDRESPNNQVIYRILNGNVNNTFSLNETSGELLLQRTINASLIQQFTLVIEARDAGSPSLSNITTITINIIDENNNHPYFLFTPYVGEVLENTNNSILKVHAADPDLDSNLTYQVIKDDSGLCNFSFVDNVLYARYLDAEATVDGTIVCSITVTDGVYNATTTVEVHVVDVNDNWPVFDDSANYTVEIVDTLTVGSHVTSVTATDADLSTLYESVLYFITEDSVNVSYFSINHMTGDISVLQPLGGISGQTVNVSVIARDAGLPSHNTTKILSIYVREVNVHTPDFNTTIIHVKVRENDDQPFTALMNATDMDGDGVSYKILSGNNQKIFSIDGTTGLLSLSNDSFRFDYESKSDYSLVVEATDDAHYPKSATVTVMVEVIDVNEAPVIDVPINRVYKKINTTVDDVITTVRVFDPDIRNEAFREHNFSIISIMNSTQRDMSSFFNVDKNGTISVKQPLTVNGTFLLTVQVKNINLLVNSTQIEVVVSNVDGITMKYNLTENNTVPYTFGQLNGNFIYTIIAPSKGNFSVRPNGTEFDLLTYTVFDYEEMDSSEKQVDFSIEGVNKITNILEKQIQVQIKVVNLNDNPPEFNSSLFEIQMYENLTVGEVVTMVTATDKDGTLTDLTYDFSNNTNMFRIDPNTGAILLNEHWNFENSTNHKMTLIITCKDTKYTVNTTVQISLLDVNDNFPQFNQTSYNFSVDENISVGVRVPNMSVVANDVDTMDKGKLTYQILPGKGGSYFQLDGYSGSFIVAQPLDYEKIHDLEFDLVVYDTAQHNSTTTVTVHILDVNDNAPVFYKTSYDFSVKEGTNYTGEEFGISASDKDSGNNGQVTLELQSPYGTSVSLQTNTSYDSLNNSMGFLHIIDLDRDSSNVRHENGTAIYEVTVIASDDGDPKLTSSVLVSIYVEDVNDCPPEFSQSNYNISIQEGVSIGQQVAMFTTTDCDYNPAFTQANFTLTGDGHESFRTDDIGKHTGALIVAEHLDWHTKEKYRLNLTATDGQNTNSVMLYITVLDTNDNAPTFNQSDYNFNVTENQKSEVVVGTVSATDQDVGLNGNVTYSITSGNLNQSFSIITDFNSSTGTIKTTTTLDRETQATYIMIITATDSAKRDSRQGTCTVTVHVLDVNDNSPVFTSPNEYKSSVIENTKISAKLDVVPRIAASDVDFGSNGTDGIRFSLLSNDPKYFDVNNVTGEITVAGEIDRETVGNKLQLVILAEDSNGSPDARNSLVTLTVTVIDLNDNPPVFVGAPYMYNVSENSNSSTSVGRVSVTDADVNGTEHVQFRIIHGDDEKFYIDTGNASGTIRVMGNLDREIKDVYNLTVTANDGVNESNTTVTVNILDRNDNAPVFINKTDSVTIEEDQPAGTLVYTVMATDDDQTKTSNSRVTYRLRNEDDFKIAANGTIYTVKQFDRETRASYEVEVIAVDSGTPQLTGTMIVIVSISDVNDNTPRFMDENSRNITEKQVNIVEKCPVDTVVALVVAKDEDIGENGAVVFSIREHFAREYFTLDQIDGTTAVVKVSKPVVINTLINSNITGVSGSVSDSVVLAVTINARDNATLGTRRNSSMILRVVVEPINDAMPVFMKPDKPYKIPENIAVGLEVGKCLAEVLNASFTHLTYSLLDNRTKADFSLNPDDCTIKTKAPIDRERIDRYNFPVMVKDGRTPERTAYTQIEIIVQDMNDNSPQFYQSIVKLDIEENTDYLQPINMSAWDADVGENAHLSYSLSDDFDETFIIQNDTGLLNITKQLDYEEYTNFTVLVRATDHGHPALTSTATLYINVLDVNDNSPQFYCVNYTITKPENSVGRIDQFYANDSDSGLNGEIVYSLNSTSDSFEINQLDGWLYLTRGLDYETQTKHFLQITATDHGSPPRSSSVNITVNVQDVYDFVPQFDREIYECNISRLAAVRHPVIDMNVTYGNNNVTFLALKGPGADFFNVDKDTGLIYLAQHLDPQKSDYILTVTAVDKTDDRNVAVTTVIVKVVDSLLAFPHKEYHVNLTENIGRAQLIDLNTTEEINGQNVLYKIIKTEPNVFGVFSIDNAGKISCHKPVDREAVTQYVLYITAEPTNKRSRRDTSNTDNVDYSTLVRLVVQILDENDSPPVFPITQKQIYGVPRDARAGYYLTPAVQAIDPDTPESGGSIQYKAIAGDTNMFDVAVDTGDVVVLRAISASPKSEFNLTVLAFDPTDHLKNDTITIQIRVIEDNERLLLVTNLPIDEFRRKQEDLVRNMSATLGVDIETEKIESHKEFTNGSIHVFLDRSDFYFHAINRTTGMPISSAELKALIDSHGDFLSSLFHGLQLSSVISVGSHDSTGMGISEIALICVAVFIFLGGLVGIIIAYSALRGMNNTEGSETKGKGPKLDDFELGTIRSHSSRASSMRPVAAVNPAFMETELNTSITHSVPDDKPPSEPEQESQEIRFEFNEEPIDQNLPEAVIRDRDMLHDLAWNGMSKDSGVGNTSFSSHEILHSGSSAGSDGNSGTSSTEQNDDNLDVLDEPRPDYGPIMTSSPKIVRFRDVEIIPDSNENGPSGQERARNKSDSKTSVLKLTEAAGGMETDTDDGIDADIDHVEDEGIDIQKAGANGDASINQVNITITGLDDTTDDYVAEAEEVTSF